MSIGKSFVRVFISNRRISVDLNALAVHSVAPTAAVNKSTIVS